VNPPAVLGTGPTLPCRTDQQAAVADVPPSGRAPLDANTITAPAILVSAVASKTRYLNTIEIARSSRAGQGAPPAWDDRRTRPGAGAVGYM
jgi:hypothetical protein